MLKYQKVMEAVKRDINSGRYQSGDKLPSITKLSKEWNMNSDTIIKAYQHLEKEHYIYAVPKSGYYVVKSVLNNSSGKIDLVTVKPPGSIHPFKEFSHCMEKAIALYGPRLFEYSDPKGMEELTGVLTKYLMDFQVFVKDKDIFVTNGAQQALYLLSVMPFPGNAATILVEQPTYSVLLKTLTEAHIPVKGIKRTKDGIDLEELEEIFLAGGIKFFYTMPRYQNPTGFSYSTKQKKELLRLSRKYNIYIVEDDYLADLEMDTKADPIYSQKEKNKVIYIRSFSKTLLPGLRLGMVILPKELQENFLTLKQGMDLTTSILPQGALEIYLKSNMYRIHREKIKAYYRERMEQLKNACEIHLKGMAEYYIPLTGIYAYIELKEPTAKELVTRLAKQGIRIESTDNCYLTGYEHPQGIRVCICNSKEEELNRVMELIGKEIVKAHKLIKRMEHSNEPHGRI